MSDLQSAKAVVRSYYDAFDASAPEDRLGALQAHAAPDYHWRGMHPFHEQASAEACISAFWTPYLDAFSSVQRREDIFLAGLNDAQGAPGTWVGSMGHLMGLFDGPWLGIAPTGKIALLRYAEFHHVKDGKITETALFCDILSVMYQAGLSPLPPQTGADFIHPGPRTHDGLLIEAQDPAEGTKTLDLVNRMCGKISEVNELIADGHAPQDLSPAEEMAQNWHEDMLWYGPAGIGATYTIPRYIEQHQQPFRRELADRVFNGHVARIAEGSFCGFFGWPNLSVTPTGGYMGLPASNEPAPMRVVDFYRRDGDRLAENWVFIDMLHFLNAQGLDVLGRMGKLTRTST